MTRIGRAFRPITPRVGDFAYASSVTSIPSPELESFSFISEGGTATLCGFDVYASPTAPGRRYRTQTFSGSARSCINTNECPGGPVAQSWVLITPSGQYTYNVDTCAQVNNQIQTHVNGGSTCGAGGGAPADYPIAQYADPAFFYNGTGLTSVITATSYSVTADEVCRTVSGIGVLQAGTSVKTLSDEDTEDDAIARASPIAGTEAVAYRQTRGAAEFTFDWQNSTVSCNLVNLVSGQDYIITIDLLTEDYGGGSPANTQLDYPFTASSSSQTVEIPFTAEPGKQVTASNPTLSLG